MTRNAFSVGLLVLVAAISVGLHPLSAQGVPRFEIGIIGGVTHFDTEVSAGQTSWGVPAGGVRGMPTVYATFFSESEVHVEAQFGFSGTNAGGGTFHTVGAALRGLWLKDGVSEPSPYVAVNAAVFRFAGEADFGAGLGIGHRFLPVEHVAVRVEGGARRWFGERLDFTEISFSLMGGVVVR